MVASTHQSALCGWDDRGWSPGTDPAASGIHASTDPETLLKKKQFYIYYWLQEIDKKSKKVKTKLQQFKFIFIHCNWEPLFPHLFCMLCCRQWGRGALWHLATRWMPRPDTSHPYSRSTCLPLRRSRDRS